MKRSADCAKKCPQKALKAPFKPFFCIGARVHKGFALFGLFQARKNPLIRRVQGYRFVSIRKIRAIIA
jgi:hypothetical protein